MTDTQPDQSSSKQTELEEQELLNGSKAASSFETLANVEPSPSNSASEGLKKLSKQWGETSLTYS